MRYLDGRTRHFLRSATDQLERLSTAVLLNESKLAESEALATDSLVASIHAHLREIADFESGPSHEWEEPRPSRSITERKIRRCKWCRCAYRIRLDGRPCRVRKESKL